ncbi:MAG: 50S ribosomal protein L23 [Acidobacteria bacterium]|nr:MAG: 50S ribosomal protein L23 [Acidobacteriota bacterium]
MKKLSVWEILKAPVITEKSTLLKEVEEGGEENQVLTFRVDKRATKEEIRRAVEEIFNVKVEKVHTINYQGKLKRRGRLEGRRPSWKKAYVTLKKGEHVIDYSEVI